MSPFTRSNWHVWPIEYMGLLICVALLMSGFTPFVQGLVSVLLVGLAWLAAERSNMIYKQLVDSHYNEMKWRNLLNCDPPRAKSQKSPWKLQRQVMQMSGQTIGNQPQINKTSILYGALILEEVGETMTALGKAIKSVTFDNSDLDVIADVYGQIGVRLDTESRRLRHLIAASKHNPLSKALAPELTIELLDGITDVVVVIAGLGEASGLPGEDAYNEVVSSNISKANPATGVIDKTPDGKWIKGKSYKAPDLHAVLLRQPELRI